ncbi:CHASE2 domain-containing protein [Ferrigenium sp. UT5]|uniref:CHASE2 domain-containing protein n=1 Tax=Ferrigenium sp. UT5 TaxID=3242105 RepID=UPI0035504F08
MALTSSLRHLTKRVNSRGFSVLLSVLSVLAVLSLYYTQNAFLEAFEARTYDLRFRDLRGAIPLAPNIAIIAIDDKSIAELGRYPWPRNQYALLLEKLKAAQAKAVLFDAFFPEREDIVNDQTFAAAMKKSGNAVLAELFEFDANGNVRGVTRSLPEFARAAAGSGQINLFPDEDGVNRRVPVLIEAEGKLTPSLGMMAAMLALNEKEFAREAFEVRLGERRIPVDEQYAMWINYTGPPGGYPRYSFTDVVHGRVAAELLKGKILFVGATALGVYDMRVTPFHGNTPGVEIHATVADNIISDRFIRQGGPEALLDIFSIVLLGLLAYFLTTRLKLYGAIPATAVLLALYLWFAYALFESGHWINIIYPTLSAVLALLVGGSFRYLVLERSAREMRTMFSSYLSPKLVARLEKNPDAARIGGDSKEVTVLFTDIKGFTSFSEAHSPQVVVSRLNEYLGAMVQVIEQHDGTIDKFIGDAIMAYWGAPLSQPDHAKLAMRCVAAMAERLAALQQQWASTGLDGFSIRGGLNSGEVVAGNVGFAGKKMEYTVIGDTVNLASRLEGTAKYYGITWLVGESTYRLAPEACPYRELDKIRVVGKHLPVTIYEPQVGPAALSGEQLAVFHAALAHYRQRDWLAAQDGFSRLAAEIPQDQPCRLYAERCVYFAANPPAQDWDGVFNRAEK